MSERSKTNDSFRLENVFATSLSYPFLIAFLSSLTISIIKTRSRFSEPYLWAEDALDFFTVAFCQDRAGLFQPVAGLILPLQRAVARLIFSASPYYSAELIALFSTSVFCLSTSYVARKSFRPLINSDYLRVLIALMTPLALGSGEILGRLTCLTYSLTWWLTLGIIELIVAQPSSVMSLALSLATFSNPLAVSVFPFLVLTWCRIKSVSKYLLAVSILSGFLINTILTRLHRTGTAQIIIPDALTLFRETLDSFLTYSLLVPFLGLGVSDFLVRQGEIPTILVGSTLLASICLLLFRYSNERFYLLYLWSLPVTYTAAHLFSRTYTINPFEIGMIPIANRFLFIFSLPSIIISFSSLSASFNEARKRSILLVLPSALFIASFVPASFIGWSLLEESAASSWSEFRSLLQSNSSDPISVVIEVPPLGTTSDGRMVASNKILVQRSETAYTCQRLRVFE